MRRAEAEEPQEGGEGERATKECRKGRFVAKGEEGAAGPDSHRSGALAEDGVANFILQKPKLLPRIYFYVYIHMYTRTHTYICVRVCKCTYLCVYSGCFCKTDIHNY